MLIHIPSTFPSSSLLDQLEGKKCTNKFHDIFDIILVYKASNNFDIVWREFYLHLMEEVLDISDK